MIAIRKPNCSRVAKRPFINIIFFDELRGTGDHYHCGIIHKNIDQNNERSRVVIVPH